MRVRTTLISARLKMSSPDEMNYFQILQILLAGLEQLRYVVRGQSDRFDQNIGIRGTENIFTFPQDEFVFSEFSNSRFLASEEISQKVVDVFRIGRYLIFPANIAPQGMKRLEKI